MTKKMDTPRIRVLSIAYPNKRRQMVRAIPEIRTDVTIFADDDVLWPAKLLQWMLAPLEDESYGGVGTNQRLRRAESPKLQQRIYGYLNALYLERRNFDCASCMYMDGGLPCLSGRTVAYRTEILQDEAFTHNFTHEEWLGRYRLNADDDNFITRWLVTHNKKIAYQYHKEAEVLTTLEDNPNFPWSTYAVYQTTVLQWAFFWDCLIIYSYLLYSESWDYEIKTAGLTALLTWMLVSKFIKLLGHYIRYPADFLLLPISIAFGYLHGLIKAKAMLSLNVTAWGTRDGADDEDAYRMIRVVRKQQDTGPMIQQYALNAAPQLQKYLAQPLDIVCTLSMRSIRVIRYAPFVLHFGRGGGQAPPRYLAAYTRYLDAPRFRSARPGIAFQQISTKAEVSCLRGVAHAPCEQTSSTPSIVWKTSNPALQGSSHPRDHLTWLLTDLNIIISETLKP
ncbi:MAG: hypothetical protein Q9164_004479 [Protoblastenia rupestris]